MNSNRLLKISEVCSYLSLSKSSIYNLIADGALNAPIKIGRSSRWRLSDLDSFIERQAFGEALRGLVAASYPKGLSMNRMHGSI